MTILKVPDMHCEHCVQRISQALSREGMSFQVDLSHKTVAVEGDEAVIAAAIEALDDLGFPAQPS